MRPNVTRAHLLEQHDEIRRCLAVAEELAERVRDGALALSELGPAVLALLQAFVRHNRSEEALLEPLLRLGDDYSEARVSRMHEEHLEEHELLRISLGDDLRAVARVLPDLAETLRAHMDAEERTFLHPAVLRDHPR